MNQKIFIVLILPFILLCNGITKNPPVTSVKIIFKQLDKDILKEVFDLFEDDKNVSTSELIVKVGEYFKETPYVAHTLETTPEQLVVNLREMDCTTFAENCLAIARTIKSGKPTFDQFTHELALIRYRDGKINGYTSRLHYFSDWIYNNQQKGIVKDLSGEIANTRYDKVINFMSTHPASYKQLKDSSFLINTVVQLEKEISARKMYYIPEDLVAQIGAQLQVGDIVAITTNIAGLDIAHVAILVRKEDQFHLLNASSIAEQVEVSRETLQDYLLNSKSATGIMVARPL